MSKISTYLTEGEYRCRCCDGLPPSLDLEDIATPYQILFDAFDAIREEWGKPIYVTSGYRCPTHNAFVGGTVLSVHMFGLALDCLFDEDEVIEADDMIEDMFPDLRRGRYSNFIHIDCGYFIYPRATDNWREGARWIG